jgi:uncharacterized protein YsxB (DUF464 family)
MVTIQLFYDAEKRGIKFTASGHAGQAESGKDIVCSAVSMLTYTLAQVMLCMDAEGWFKISPTVKLQDGEALIDAECDGDREYAELKIATLFAKAGFALLQTNYPDYVKFIINEA